MNFNSQPAPGDAVNKESPRTSALNTCPDPFAQSVSGMFGRIAGAYDFLNRLLSGGLDIYWREVLVKELLRDYLYANKNSAYLDQGNGLRVLDLATGTFDVALSLRRASTKRLNSDMKVAALDLCLPMLQAGKPKLLKRGEQKNIWPAVADGLYLPLTDNSVDLACISFGIRNIKPRPEAFKEFYRVLKPGGKLCILEFASASQPIWGGFYNFYLNKILPGLGRLISGDGKAYKYLAESIRDFASAPELAEEMRGANFANVNFRTLSAGIVCLHYAHKLP